MTEQQTEQHEVKEAATTAAVAAAEATWPQTRAVLRLILIVLAVAGFIWALYRLESVILLLILSIFFAYLIAPLVEIVHRPLTIRGRERLMPRALAIGIVYLFLFGALAITIILLLPIVSNQMTELAQQAPGYFKDVQSRAQNLQNFYQRARLPASVRDTINGSVGQILDSIKSVIGDALGRVPILLTYIPWLVLIPILAFFLLKDADSFRRSALQMLPTGRLRWRGDEFFQDVNSTLAAYIRAQLTACLLIGVVCTVGFVLIGVPYAVVLGIIAGLFEFIPLAGPLVVALLAMLLASFHSMPQTIGVFVFLVVLRIIHDYVIYPRIIGQGIHLHPLSVILAILCGAELAGVAGIFLAIPVTAIISVTYRHWMEHKGAEEGIVASLLKPAEVVAVPATESSGVQRPASGVEA